MVSIVFVFLRMFGRIHRIHSNKRRYIVTYWFCNQCHSNWYLDLLFQILNFPNDCKFLTHCYAYQETHQYFWFVNSCSIGHYWRRCHCKQLIQYSMCNDTITMIVREIATNLNPEIKEVADKFMRFLRTRLN